MFGVCMLLHVGTYVHSLVCISVCMRKAHFMSSFADLRAL
jgi:hypothetical protein